jgi:ribosomal protein S24E
MKFKLIQEKNVPVLNRKEYDLSVEFEGATPKTEDIKNGVVQQLKSDTSLTVVKKINTKYGGRSAKLEIYVYDNEKSRKSIEEIQKHKALKAKREEELKKHKEAKAVKPAENKPEAAKEASKEEVKQEVKNAEETKKE